MEFRIIDKLPTGVEPIEVEKAVASFVNDSHCKDDKNGLFRQTLENIANILVHHPSGNYLWLADKDGEVTAYALTHVTKDVDNSMCYYMTQAWLHPKYRNTGLARKFFEQLRNHGKSLLCRHIIIPSSRSTRPYLRWLGKSWHTYVTLLKEDI